LVSHKEQHTVSECTAHYSLLLSVGMTENCALQYAFSVQQNMKYLHVDALEYSEASDSVNWFPE